MANKKITDATTATSVAGTDKVFLNQGGDLKQVDLNSAVANSQAVQTLNSNLDITFSEAFYDISDLIDFNETKIRKIGNIIEIYFYINVKNDINGNSILLMRTKYPPKITYKIFQPIKSTIPYNLVSNCSIWLKYDGDMLFYGSLPSGGYYLQGIYTI